MEDMNQPASLVRRDGSRYRYGSWEVTIDGDPDIFTAELVWAEQAVIGRGSAVHFLELSTGKLLQKVEVSGYFGHLETWEDRLFVCGMRDLHLFAPPRRELWCARDIAVDGITSPTVEGSIVRVHCEMDPPGGWFDVELDLETGRELGRKPDFSEGYEGFYGKRE